MSDLVSVQALQTASVTGWFTLDELCAAISLKADDHQRRDQVWRHLAPLANELVTPSGTYCWQLGPDTRREVLGGFYALPQLDRFMSHAPAPHVSQTHPDRDRFGQVLQQVLRRERISFADPGDKASPDRLQDALLQVAAILDAVQFAEAVPALTEARIPIRMHRDRPVAQMTLAEIKTLGEAKIKELQRRRDIRIVLPDTHFGYSGERKTLSAFARGQTDEVRPLLLTGVGGAGKSALLSRQMMTWRRADPDMLTVLLDFDRRQLNAGEPVEIMQEFLRQVVAGLGLRGLPRDSATITGLREMRHEIALFKTSTTDGKREVNSAQGSNIRFVLARLDEDWGAVLRDLRLTLVLDTFEAVDRMAGYFRLAAHERGERPASNAVVTQILDLLDHLQDRYLPNLRVIVSGREEPLSKDQLDRWFGLQLRLEGLSAISGAKLLRHVAEGFDSQTRALFDDDAKTRRVASLLAGHPLALIAFARYAHDNPKDIDGLIADLETREGFQAEFAQVFLYRRILNRITDDAVRALAHPGLMLRRLDANAIQHVLAAACLDRGPASDNPVTADEAQELFDRLRNQYWLVEPVPGDASVLRHVPDLRRLMLDGLLSGPSANDAEPDRDHKLELLRRAHEVCRLAARHYADSTDPESDLDAIYYSAFNNPIPSDMTETLARQLELHLGDDLQTMPIAWRARIKFMLKSDLSPAEQQTLSAEDQEQTKSRTFVDVRQTGFTSKMEDPFSLPADTAAPDDMLSMTFGSAPARQGGSAPAQAPAPFDLPDVSSPGVVTRHSPIPVEEMSASDLSRQIELAWTTGNVADIFDPDAEDPAQPIAGRFLRRLLDEPTEAERFSDGVYDAPLTNPVYIATLLCATECPIVDRDPERERGQNEIPGGFSAVLLAAEASLSGDTLRMLEGLRAYLNSFRDLPVATNRLPARMTARVMRGGAALEDFGPDLNFQSMALAAGLPHTPEALSDALKDRDAFFLQGTRPLYDLAAEDALTVTALERVYRGLGPFHPRTQDFQALSPNDRATFTAILRGLNPELQDPLIGLLGRSDPDFGEAAVRQVSDGLILWPNDLQFTAKSAYDSSIAPTIVETADRCGALPALIEALAVRNPQDCRILAAVYDLITRTFFDPDS